MSEFDEEIREPEDKSLSYYGKVYNRLLDPLIKPARDVIVDHIPESSRVLDIGCGTGVLCFDLKSKKNCRVVGIDLSRKMLDFAESINPYDEVEFLHRDATDLKGLTMDAFDYVVILNVIHELNLDNQKRVVTEACRVGKVVFLFDSNVPLPWNISGLVKRVIEISFGFEHYPQFRSFVSEGGILGILDAAGISTKVTDISVYSQGCNQLVAVSK
jgi:ubiquinone/menaquinone biosynthesis C-methylase UbiE